MSHFRSTQNLTPLHIAAFFDSLECFIFLINLEFNINALSADDYEPFDYACAGGSLEIVTYILTRDKNKIKKRFGEIIIFFYLSNTYFIFGGFFW